jgi:F0F1-type ATP synthase epsilon subunit
MAQPQPIPPLNVTIRNREKVLFSGQVTALTSVNEKGLFDVLPQHSNFISIIKDYVTIHNPDKTTQKFDLTTGVMQVTDNNINIFLGILTPQVTPQRKISALEYLKSHPTKPSK